MARRQDGRCVRCEGCIEPIRGGKSKYCLACAAWIGTHSETWYNGEVVESLRWSKIPQDRLMEIAEEQPLKDDDYARSAPRLSNVEVEMRRAQIRAMIKPFGY